MRRVSVYVPSAQTSGHPLSLHPTLSLSLSLSHTHTHTHTHTHFLPLIIVISFPSPLSCFPSSLSPCRSLVYLLLLSLSLYRSLSSILMDSIHLRAPSNTIETGHSQEQSLTPTSALSPLSLSPFLPLPCPPPFPPNTPTPRNNGRNDLFMAIKIEARWFSSSEDSDRATGAIFARKFRG